MGLHKLWLCAHTLTHRAASFRWLIWTVRIHICSSKVTQSSSSVSILSMCTHSHTSKCFFWAEVCYHGKEVFFIRVSYMCICVFMCVRVPVYVCACVCACLCGCRWVTVDEFIIWLSAYSVFYVHSPVVIISINDPPPGGQTFERARDRDCFLSEVY